MRSSGRRVDSHAATVPLDSPLKSLSDLKGAKVLKRPAVVGTTTGSTNHFAFIAAAHYLGLTENQDFTLRSTPPGDLATGPKGLDVYTIWEPHGYARRKPPHRGTRENS